MRWRSADYCPLISNLLLPIPCFEAHSRNHAEILRGIHALMQVKNIRLLAIASGLILCVVVATSRTAYARSISSNASPCLTYSASPLPSAVLRLAVLGDSLAEGYGTSDPVICNFGYQIQTHVPAQVQDHVALSYTTFAMGGARSADLLAGANGLAAGRPDLLVIEAGTNDVRWSTPLSDFQRDYSGLIDAFAGFPAVDLVQRQIVCVSVWPSPGFDDPTVIANYDAIIQSVCQSVGGHYVDITPLYQQMDHITSFASDGNWHPNDAGAQMIATAIDQALITAQIFDVWCGTPALCMPPAFAQTASSGHPVHSRLSQQNPASRGKDAVRQP